jgi:hypothetical protein
MPIIPDTQKVEFRRIHKEALFHTHRGHYTSKNGKLGLGILMHAYNPRYSEGGIQEVHSSRIVQAKI